MKIRNFKNILFFSSVLCLILVAFSSFAAENPATRIVVKVPGTININPRGEALVDVTLTLPLAYFVFLENVGKSSNKTVDISFPAGSGIVVKRISRPAGKKYKNDLVLSGSGTFQVTILDQGGLRAGSAVKVPMQIEVQIASTKTVYAAYILQETLNLKVGGKAQPVRTQPPVVEKPVPALNRQIMWLDDYNKAVSLATRNKQYMLLFFTSVSGKCSICDWMDANTFGDTKVIQAVNQGFVAVRIPDKKGGKLNPDLKSFKIKGYPTVMVADSRGKVFYNQMGRITVATFLKGIEKFAVSGPSIPEVQGPYHKNMAAVLYDKNDTVIIFLADGQFIKYNLPKGRYQGKPRPITNRDWKGLEPFKTRIVAALNWGSNKAHIILSSGQYLRVDLTTRAVDPGYPKPINAQTWPGLERYRAKIVGAVRWKSEKIFFFVSTGEYLRYDMRSKRIEPGYPKAINTSTWKDIGRFSRDILGVANGEKGIAYFFIRNGNIIKYDINTNRIIK